MIRRPMAVVSAIALASATLTISATGAISQADGPEINVDPGAAAAGTTVTVSGSGFDGDCGVLLTWDTADGLPLGGAPVGADGTFTAQVTIPADTHSGHSAINAFGRQYALDPAEGCAGDSGTSASGSINVSSAAAAKGQTISLIARSVSAPGVDRAVIAQANASGVPAHAIVQLHTLPEPGDLTALVALGITPLAYLNAKDGSGSAYLASIASGVDASSATFGELVRGLHRLLPVDKVETALAASNAPGSNILDANVMFFSDVSAATAETVLGAVGVTSVASFGNNVYGATLSRSQIQRLATYDAVQFVAEAPEPGQYDLDTSRDLSNVDEVQRFDVPSATYLGLSGVGVQVSIHDSGVDEHHGDFAGRMIRTNHPVDGGDHGTHVASIAVGSGAMSDQLNGANMSNGGTPFQWRGMAPQAGIAAFGSQTGHDAGTMADAIVVDGVDVSNHSYSYNDGQYVAQMVNIDTIIRGDSPGIPARPQVFSAGNQGQAPQYGQNSGYFALSKSCKNCIMVANLQNNGALSGGSSHGPTPDGRVKPDVGANGTSVTAAGADVDDDNVANTAQTLNSYRVKGGTSMATPVVTGVIALLLQQYGEQFGVDIDVTPPLPSTTKAILIQTAIDQVGTASGTNPDTGAATVYGAGPDWGTGYGLVDANAASALMAAASFLEDSVSESDTSDIHYAQVAAGQAELKVTLAWDDLPGTPNANHATPQLVNDLDILLVGPNGEVVRPLVLPAATQFDCVAGTAGVQTGSCAMPAGPGVDPGPWPSAATAINAAPGTDRLNNVEQAVLANPAPGLWQVRVSVLNTNGTLRLPLGGTQSYSLAGVTDARADLRISKSASPNPMVLAGNELFYTVSATNDGPDTASGVVVVDTLPTDVIYLSDDAGCVYTAGPAHQLTCALGDLASGQTRTIVIKTLVKSNTVVNEADGTKNIVNLATVSSTTPDLNTTNNTISKITFVQDSSDLKVTKICKPDDPLPAGSTGTCELFVDNLGPSDARAVVLKDKHVSDGAFTIAGATPAPACAIAGDEVTCNLGNLAAASSSEPGRAEVVVTLTATEDVDVNNVATVRATTSDPNTSNNQDEEGVQFYAVTDLSITKTGPDAATAGTDITYNLSVINDGPSTATGVVINDVLPSSVTVVSVTCSNVGTANAGQPGNPLAPTTCSFGTLAPAASRTMTIVVHVKPDTLGVIHNDARVNSATFDDDLSNNLATKATNVTGSADLSITKSGTPNPVIAGNELTYTIAVVNAGPSTAFDVVITDTLPAATTFVSGVDGNGATVCALVQIGIVVCELGDMAPGASATVFLTVDVKPSTSPGTTITNRAVVSSSTNDPDGLDNMTTEDTPVNTSADVWLDKRAGFRSGGPSNYVVYTLVVHNDGGCETDAQSTLTPTCGAGGPSDARGIVVTDRLPLDAKKLVVQYLSPQCTYSRPTHTVTCAATAVPVGASVTFVIESQISGSVGTILNRASLTTTTPDPNVANNANDASTVHSGGTGGKGRK